MTMGIVGIRDVYYNVSDMAAALAFYRDVLGMRVVDADDYWASLDVGGVRLGLHRLGPGPIPPVPRDEHGAHAGATVTFAVADVRAAYDELARRGVRFLSGVSSQPWGDAAVFEDPDGNVMKIMSVLPDVPATESDHP